MNANIDNFPRFAFIVDSLRQIYPDLVLVSAGDNQTGHPANDQCEPKGMPVTELMNAVEFDLTALGDRDFDVRQENLGVLTSKAQFDFMCSNMDLTNLFKTCQSKILELENGLKIGFASFVSLDENGKPYCHPDFVSKLTFQDPYQTAQKYVDLKDECNVVVFFNKLGLEGDKKMAEEFPKGKLDIIFNSAYGDNQPKVENHNGVVIAHAGVRLSSALLTDLTVKADGTVLTDIKPISVGKEGSKNTQVESMVKGYLNNPVLTEKIATLETPLTFNQLGLLMADAISAAKSVDLGLVNAGNIRTPNWNFKEVTPFDVYVLDPYTNQVTTVTDLQTTHNMISYLKRIKVVKSYDNDTRLKINKK